MLRSQEVSGSTSWAEEQHNSKAQSLPQREAKQGWGLHHQSPGLIKRSSSASVKTPRMESKITEL